jgi:cob(I)alamin adenosyltransferase
MAIYTRKGDKGKTSLGSGVRVSKDSLRVEAYGTIDELNAHLGLVKAQLGLSGKKYAGYLSEIVNLIQDDLFSVGAYLSNPANSNLVSELSKQTEMFEKLIDDMMVQMPEITNFTVPGGTVIAAQFHVCRTIARRAERCLVSLIKKEKVNEDVVKYINRLSDLLFTMNRFANFNEKIEEVIWKRR